MDTLNIKAKDIIQYAVYLITLTLYIVTINNKLDNVSETVNEWKADKKEVNLEQRQNNQIIQNELKMLGIKAELNRQNIDLNKADIEIIKIKIDRLLSK